MIPYCLIYSTQTLILSTVCSGYGGGGGPGYGGGGGGYEGERRQ